MEREPGGRGRRRFQRRVNGDQYDFTVQTRKDGLNLVQLTTPDVTKNYSYQEAVSSRKSQALSKMIEAARADRRGILVPVGILTNTHNVLFSADAGGHFFLSAHLPPTQTEIASFTYDIPQNDLIIFGTAGQRREASDELLRFLVTSWSPKHSDVLVTALEGPRDSGQVYLAGKPMKALKKKGRSYE